MKKFNQSLLSALRDANKEFGKNVYLEHKRELKALIEDTVIGDDRDEVRRTVSALMTILDNARSYRNFCDILENLPQKISEYEFNLAVSEIERNTAISEEFIKEVLTYIIAAGGGTADIGRQIKPDPSKPEPEPNIPPKPEPEIYKPEIYEPKQEEKKTTKKNHTNLIVLLILCIMVIAGLIIAATNNTNVVYDNENTYADYYEESEKSIMPNLIGMSFLNASDLYSSSFAIKILSDEYSNQYPEGAIIWQEIAEGEEYEIGVKQIVVLSRGPEASTTAKTTATTTVTTKTTTSTTTSKSTISVPKYTADNDEGLPSDDVYLDLCEWCDGTGNIFCTSCGGTGVSYNQICSSCGGTGIVKCNICGGDGFVD
jgi:hypothetical protein